MTKRILLAAGIVAMAVPPLGAASIARHAVITGDGGEIGKCTIEVNVDGAAEVDVLGDTGMLRTVSGQPAFWRRFQCNEPLPPNPADFRFVGVDGRGSVLLLRDPRNTRGKATVRIDDRRGGREGYTFDLQWRRIGGWPPPQHGPGAGYPSPGHPSPGGFPMAKAIQICQDSVADRLQRDGYSSIAFERTIPDNNPGRNDWVIGTVSGKRGFRTTSFSFSCSVDFRSGRVRSVDVRR